MYTREAKASTSDVHTSNINACTVRYTRALGHPNMGDKVKLLVAFSVLILGFWLARILQTFFS